jgi:hypothetical protein
MIDLYEWQNRLWDLRTQNAPSLTMAQMHDLVDGLRKLLWPLCGGLFAYPGLTWHPIAETRKVMSRDERLAWLAQTKKLVDLARVLITSYLTGGEVTTWKPNNQPEVYYLVYETVAGLSPAEVINLLRSAFYAAKKEPDVFTDERRELLDKLTIAR